MESEENVPLRGFDGFELFSYGLIIMSTTFVVFGLAAGFCSLFFR